MTVNLTTSQKFLHFELPAALRPTRWRHSRSESKPKPVAVNPIIFLLSRVVHLPPTPYNFSFLGVRSFRRSKIDQISINVEGFWLLPPSVKAPVRASFGRH